jgi:hypothetical protein
MAVMQKQKNVSQENVMVHKSVMLKHQPKNVIAHLQLLKNVVNNPVLSLSLL